MNKLTYERARELFNYEPASGVLTWRVNKGSRGINGAVISSVSTQGYLRVSVSKKSYLVHRIAFLLMTGRWPDEQIDHANGVRTDNRWENLRPATSHQNTMNQGVRDDNTSGIKGVYFCKKRKKWVAQIVIHGQCYNLGRFLTIEEAKVVRLGASALVFGEFNREVT